jgi:uncharacterized membrane protein
MNSVNSTIELMTRRGTLSGMFGAYLYAAFLVAGPWIFTVFGLLSLSAINCDSLCDDMTVFRSIIIYNSMYALIVTSPLAFIIGRYASEQVQGGRDDTVFYALNASLGIYALLCLGVVGPFYVLGTTLDGPVAIASIYNAALIGCSWLLIPFLGAVRAYVAVLAAFGVGSASMLAFGFVLHDPQAASLVLAFNCGFAITDLILLAAVVRHFGAKFVVDPELRKRVRTKWELPAAGAAYALGLWIDKIIMWHSDPSTGLRVAGALQTTPSYDSAMFWAQLSSVPIIAVFFVHVETRFSALMHIYQVRMQQKASLRELNEIVKKISAHVVASMFGLFGALVVIAGVMIMVSFIFMDKIGLRPSYMGIFRVALCSMAFYTSAMFCFTFLLHLDVRRPALLIVSTFLVLNGTITLMLLPLGSDLYGYGNMIASTAALLIGFRLVLRELSCLHYHAFITNNPSV